jgi:hypothetical protein
MMTTPEFIDTTGSPEPPGGLSTPLRSLWWARKGDWTKAHDLIQDAADSGNNWIHAWLHRMEGDEGNASYWYLKAGRKKPAIPLDEEWVQLATHFLALEK